MSKPKKFLTLNPFKLYSIFFRNTKTRGLALLLTLIYIISPIDLLPEAFLFVFGGVDDLILFIMFATEVIKLFLSKKNNPKVKTKIVEAKDLNSELNN
jgi:uncharacterized membrane protein YkvA (DUF1232 family)